MTGQDKIEQAIGEAKAGKRGIDAMLDTLLEGDLVVPSGAAVDPDGAGFQPVLFDRDGVPMVAVFTGTERIGEVGALAKYALSIGARDLLSRVPPGHGVVINPGQDLGFEIDPTGLERLNARHGVRAPAA